MLVPNNAHVTLPWEVTESASQMMVDSVQPLPQDGSILFDDIFSEALSLFDNDPFMHMFDADIPSGGILLFGLIAHSRSSDM
jgi:hypothetical protein